MTFLHVYLLGFAITMALCASIVYRYRHRHKTTNDWVGITICCMLISATWPLTLIAALVAATDR